MSVKSNDITFAELFGPESHFASRNADDKVGILAVTLLSGFHTPVKDFFKEGSTKAISAGYLRGTCHAPIVVIAEMMQGRQRAHVDEILWTELIQRLPLMAAPFLKPYITEE